MQSNKRIHTTISEAEASRLISKHYGLTGQVSRLAGEEDQNFKLVANDRQKYIFKISPEAVNAEELNFQCDLLDYLSTKSIGISIPTVIRSKSGKRFIELILKKESRSIRMHSWVEGKLLDAVKPRSKALLHSWGALCGTLSLALKDFQHDKAKTSYKWNPSETLDSRSYSAYFSSDLEREIAAYFWTYFESETLPLLGNLRKSINHNDAHEHNVLVSKDKLNPTICGLIDFGDAMYTETINELAICCAYASMHQKDPLRAVSFVLEGYHKIFPIELDELKALYGLITARLLITVSNAAYQKVLNPENEYLSISEKPAWEALEKWYQIPPKFALAYFRNVCGLEACNSNVKFKAFVQEKSNIFSPVVKTGEQRVAPINLEVGSTVLGNYSNYDQLENFERLLTRYFQDNQIDIGIGGYLEARNLYLDSNYDAEGFFGQQSRTIHLGLDIWTKAGSSVFAPIEGTIYGLQNNEGERNYGPTIILQHELAEGEYYYSLYGHLSLKSLEGKKIGESIERGAEIGQIGDSTENGGWPPHLHLQLVLDMLTNKGDFPGVAFAHEKEVMASICPDPMIFSGLKNMARTSLKKPSVSDLLKYRNQHLGKSLSLSYSDPIHVVQGRNQFLIDVDGKRYLDTVNNVAHVGHENPRVVQTMQHQVGILNTNTRYLHQSILDCAEALLKTLPDELSVVHFVNSGSEANELALRMCESWSGTKEMIAVEHGYHGNSNRCIDVSSYKFDGKGGKGAPDCTQIVPMPDMYRGIHKGSLQDGTVYTGYIDIAIDNIEQKGKVLSGFICESIISCGGQIELPYNYLKEVYSKVRAKRGLCIADEVQVGLGRVGSKFWGFELHEVVPDIVTIGKPLGNGHPIAAVVCTEAVANAFANGMEYFNTFGGNPVSAIAAHTVLDIIREEQLQENAQSVGKYLKTALLELQNKYPIIGQVRGQGLFLGFELVKDHASKEPAAEEAAYLVNRMKTLGVLMSTDGPLHNVIKIKPPMTFTKDNVNYLVGLLDQVFQETAMQI